jgi:hypothetical protein
MTVLGMLGGAVHRSFGVLDGDDTSFNHSYGPLREMLAAMGLNGIDLDVEEPMSLSGIVRLIDRLKNDFGSNITVTLAPVATALRKEKDKLSGLDYEGLENIRFRAQKSLGTTLSFTAAGAVWRIPWTTITSYNMPGLLRRSSQQC